MHQTFSARTRTMHPDSIRIVALAAALSLNVAVLLMAMRPLGVHLGRLHITQPLDVHFLSPPPPALPVLPTVTPQMHASPRLDVPQPAVPTPIRTEITPVSLAAPMVSAPVKPATPTAHDTATRDATTSVGSLATLVAPPPRYPAQARRAGMQGTVVLRVLVDAQGRPQQIVIQDSSGHRLLDRAARRQVLERWRFKPAMRGGHAVAAWALVPVVFTLRRL